MAAAKGTTILGTTILLAFRSIRRHLLRSFLTTLGIVIGVSAVVAMVTLGKATTAAVQQQISALGTNVLQIRPGQGFGRGGGGPRPADFKIEDIAAIRGQIAGVSAVAAQAQSSTTAIYEGANWTTTINGTTLDYFRVQPWPVASGRTFTRAEENAGKAVCMIGNTVRSNLFRDRDAVGTRIRVGNVSCDVVGTLATKGQAGFGGDQDDVIIMPLKAVQRRFTGSTDVRAILVGVDTAYSTAAVQSAISDQPCGGGHRHHEHHAGLGHRAHPRDRHPPRHWRGRERSADAVSGRSGRAVLPGRTDRAAPGPSHHRTRHAADASAMDVRSADQHFRLRDFGDHRRCLWLFPGPPRSIARPDRGFATRIGWPRGAAVRPRCIAAALSLGHETPDQRVGMPDSRC